MVVFSMISIFFVKNKMKNGNNSKLISSKIFNFAFTETSLSNCLQLNQDLKKKIP